MLFTLKQQIKSQLGSWCLGVKQDIYMHKNQLPRYVDLGCRDKTILCTFFHIVIVTYMV